MSHINRNINSIHNYNLTTNFAVYCSNDTFASRGIGIVINKSLNYEIMAKFTDEDGRMILINIQIENSVFSMVSIYAPNLSYLYDWPVFYPSVAK
jgi:exonuclease III